MDGDGSGMGAAVSTTLPGWRRRLAPRSASPDERRNYELIQLDSVITGLIVTVMGFVPVFLVRIGASPFEVSLVTILPAVGGLLLSVPFGRLLEGSERIPTWWARSRLWHSAVYAVIAAIAVLLPPGVAIAATLAALALSTAPQSLTQVVFPIVVDGAAGPRGRFDLLGRRWALMGLGTAVTAGLAGVLLTAVPLPWNYALLFLAGAATGISSWALSRRVVMVYRGPAPARPPAASGEEAPGAAVARPARSGPAPSAAARRQFLGFVLRKALFSAGTRMVLALLPLFYVRSLGVSDGWIGTLTMLASFATVAGYLAWRRIVRRIGPRAVLLSTLAISGGIPALVVLSRSPEVVILLSMIGAFFVAGVDLALFDELLGRIPRDHLTTFSGLDASVTNLAWIVAPLTGAALAEIAGVEAAIVVGAAVSLVAALLFVAAGRSRPAPNAA
ncbi:MAG: MFS transporter [Chloroflexota bacterium]